MGIAREYLAYCKEFLSDGKDFVLISFYINDYIIARKFEAKVPVLVLICCICLLGIILLSKVVKNYLIEKIL